MNGLAMLHALPTWLLYRLIRVLAFGNPWQRERPQSLRSWALHRTDLCETFDSALWGLILGVAVTFSVRLMS